MTTTAVRSAYQPPRPPAQYDAGWLATQLSSIARALPPVATRTVKAATVLLATDTTVFCDATAGAFAVTLLLAEQVQYQTVTFKRISAAGNVTITAVGTDTIDGAATYVLAAQYKAVTLQSNGVTWLILGAV